MCDSSFLALASDTVGKRSTDRELGKADGNRIKGIAIPVKIPYTLSASLLFNPKSFKRKGISTASILLRRLTTKRLADNGKESFSTGRI